MIKIKSIETSVTEQLSFFAPETVPGTYVTSYGAPICFDDLQNYIGRIVIMDCSTQSHKWYKAIRVEKILHTADGRRLIYTANPRRPCECAVDERFFRATAYYGVRVFVEKE